VASVVDIHTTTTTIKYSSSPPPPTTTTTTTASLGTIDYIAKDGKTLVFRTCPQEKGKVIMQLGVADPVLALKAAQVIVVMVVWWW